MDGRIHHEAKAWMATDENDKENDNDNVLVPVLVVVRSEPTTLSLSLSFSFSSVLRSTFSSVAIFPLNP